MAFTGFPLDEDMFPKPPGQRRRGLHIDPGGTIAMFRLFARAFSGNGFPGLPQEKASRKKPQALPGRISNKMAPMNTPAPERSPWWQPRVHRDRRPFLLGRARMVEAARAFFSAQSFIEVDTAIFQVSPGNKAHISAFANSMLDDTGAKSNLYLHSSPEFAAKKLLAAGEMRIFSFAHVFRNREREDCTIPNSPCSNGIARARLTRD